eukprot:5491297-Pyramimonas_sp.AAC.1
MTLQKTLRSVTTASGAPSVSDAARPAQLPDNSTPGRPSAPPRERLPRLSPRRALRSVTSLPER